MSTQQRGPTHNIKPPPTNAAMIPRDTLLLSADSAPMTIQSTTRTRLAITFLTIAFGMYSKI